MKLISTLCATVIALQAFAFADEGAWTTDYAAAKKQAAEANKDLLLDFTGKSWCAWCIRLDKEVFTQDSFQAGVKDSFNLVQLDYPHDRSRLPDTTPTEKQNKELAEKYHAIAKGFPYILLCDAQGRPYASTGYMFGGPEKYLAHLSHLRGIRAKRDEAFAAADKLEGVAKAKAIYAALERMTLEDDDLQAFYGDKLAAAKAADPADEAGYAKTQADKKQVHAVVGEAQKLKYRKDFAGALALVDKAIQSGGFAKALTQPLWETRMVICEANHNIDEVIKAADEAIAADPDAAIVDKIRAYRNGMAQRKASAAAGKE